jgi:formylmethanofuran dehydrogenase subunit E
MTNLCAWCDEDVMDYLASFNGKDICVICAGEFENE